MMDVNIFRSLITICLHQTYRSRLIIIHTEYLLLIYYRVLSYIKQHFHAHCDVMSDEYITDRVQNQGGGQ